MSDETGTTAIEYSLIGALIFVAIIASMHALGGGVSAMWARISTTVTGAL